MNLVQLRFICHTSEESINFSLRSKLGQVLRRSKKMFKTRIKNCSRLFTTPLSSKAGGRSARIIPTLNVKLNSSFFIPEPTSTLLQISSMNRSLSTLVPQLSAKITPEIEQLLEISLEERSLEDDEASPGVRLAKCSHTSSCEMFIKATIEKFISLKENDDWKSLHLRDLGLKFRILKDLEEQNEKFKFGNVDLANIATVQDIIKVISTKPKVLNPWTKDDSFKEYVEELMEKGEWPSNIVFKERIERESRPPPVSQVPLY